MTSNRNDDPAPYGLLYTMLRVSDLDRALLFYCDILGMTEFRRETFTDARFTLVFVGYSEGSALIELTCNWDSDGYAHGDGYGHIALAVRDIYATCAALEMKGVNIIRVPGPMKVAPDETGHREVIAFIADPDGYKLELVEDEVA